MLYHSHHKSGKSRISGAFTLVEVVISLTIMALVFSGIVLGFTTSSKRAEWTAYNLAAQNLAQQGIEQARAAQWDPAATPPTDNCVQSNFPAVGTNVMDVPITGTNITYATNMWTISTIATNPYPLKMIRVDCTWQFGNRVFTNTVATLRAPD